MASTTLAEPSAGSISATVAPLEGMALAVAALAIGASNFLAVLDSTIANVSVPTIAGSIGISSTEGTWVITSYAVAEAITVPLTGFLTRRFGAKRTFVTCYIAFGVISLFCGLAHSLGMLIAARVLLGLSGGPLIPLSQMLLLRIFPKEKATLATVIWSMTTLTGPIAGPILGGLICDSIGWQWIFYIKVPAAIGGGLLAWSMLRRFPDQTEPAKIDGIGLGLLIVWVGALQILLDEGRNHDWFAATEVRVLAVIAVLGFASFLIWELTSKDPIVDLRVFRHRGFTAAAVTYTVGFGSFFGTLVLIPLWLQENMGYTATYAGYATGIMGILAVVCAPIVGKATEWFDPRLLVSAGLVGLALVTVWRMGFNTDVTFMHMAWPMLLMGPCIVLFFIPVTGLTLASVSPRETANAAGLSNFMRTLAGAFATSLVQTGWSSATRVNQTELAGAMTQGAATIESMIAGGASRDMAVVMLDQVVEQQSVMLATLNMFATIAIVLMFAASLIWLAPKPKGPIDLNPAH